MPMDQYQAAQADGYVDEEYDAPVKISDDQAAEERPEHGADQTRHGDEAHGADELGFGKGSDHGEPSHGKHHGAAAALQHAAGHQQVDIIRDAAEKRAEREDADRGREHAPRAETIGHPSADGDEYRQAQRIAREHGLHAERRYLECMRNGGYGRIQDGRVQRFHEKADRHQPRQEALGRVARGSGVAHWQDAGLQAPASAASTMSWASAIS